MDEGRILPYFIPVSGFGGNCSLWDAFDRSKLLPFRAKRPHRCPEAGLSQVINALIPRIFHQEIILFGYLQLEFNTTPTPQRMVSFCNQGVWLAGNKYCSFRFCVKGTDTNK